MHIEHMLRAFEEASKGGRVAIFAETLTVAQDICNEIADRIPPYVSADVCKVNGRQRIDFKESGGRIHFQSIRNSGRGLSVDRVFVPIGTARDKLEDIIPMLATSEYGVLTGY